MKDHAFACACAALALVIAPGGARAETPDDEAVDTYVEQHRQPISLPPIGSLTFGIAAATSMDGIDFGFGSTDIRQLSAAVTLRYGLATGIEIFGQVPFSRTRLRSSLLGVTERKTYSSAVVEAGARHLLFHRSDVRPEIVASASIAVPAGNLPGAEPHVRVAVAAYQVVDPVVLSAEVGTGIGLRTGEHHFDLEGKFDFAINDRISFGFGVNWSSAGADFGDPLDTGVSVTGSVTLSSPSSATSLVPYVAFGASRAAPDVTLGLSWSRRW